MDSGYYAACAGLAAQAQALDLVANNLANLGTTGYRGQQATFRTLLAGSGWANSNPLNRAVNDFGVLAGSRPDLGPGSLAATGNPLDVGISGNGFFAVQSGQGVLYTRNGSFHANASGGLVTAEGDAVLGEQGPLTVPTGLVAISNDGTLSVEGVIAGQIRMVEFPAGTALTAAGNASFTAPARSAQPAAASSMHQGMLENSNVNATMAVVNLITVQRNFEMLQRALGLFDSQLNQTAVQDLPKV
jgi:flagellar basal-body rod protein FlgF